jgi:ribosomal protein L35AE/L33A
MVIPTFLQSKRNCGVSEALVCAGKQGEMRHTACQLRSSLIEYTLVQSMARVMSGVIWRTHGENRQGALWTRYPERLILVDTSGHCRHAGTEVHSVILDMTQYTLLICGSRSSALSLPRHEFVILLRPPLL